MKKLMSATRPYIPYFPFVAVALVMIAVTIFALIRLAQPPAPPLQYSAAEFAPEKPIYAPGETLRYTPTLTLRSETEIGGVRIIVDARTRRTARLCDGTTAKPIPVLGGAEEGTEANIDGGAFVPILIPKLPPGNYWIRSFVHGYGESSGQATYRVRFRVVQACGGS